MKEQTLALQQSESSQKETETLSNDSENKAISENKKETLSNDSEKKTKGLVVSTTIVNSCFEPLVNPASLQ